MHQQSDASPAPIRGELPASGLLRRLAAMAYDALLVIALCVVPTLGLMAVRDGPVPPGDPWLRSLLLMTIGIFFVWFWSHGGQTLGMRAWRMRVERSDGTPVDVKHGVVRFVVALVSLAALGLGFWWIWIDPQRRAWHDIVADTRVAVLPKRR